MDLRAGHPRSLREKLAGYVHLPRMIDKCRAVLAGTQGDYIYPCPLDERLLAFAGLTVEQFTAAVPGQTDDRIGEWFSRTAQAHSQAEVESWSRMMLTRGPDTEEKRDYFNRQRDAIAPDRTDVTAWADLLDLEENRPVPNRNASSLGGR
jgi:hypothetical protein